MSLAAIIKELDNWLTRNDSKLTNEENTKLWNMLAYLISIETLFEDEGMGEV